MPCKNRCHQKLQDIENFINSEAYIDLLEYFKSQSDIAFNMAINNKELSDEKRVAKFNEIGIWAVARGAVLTLKDEYIQQIQRDSDE